MAGEHNFRVEAYTAAGRNPAPAAAQLRVLFQAAARFWPLLIAPLLLLSLLDRFPYPSSDATFSDLTISHYPNALYLLRALREWGQIPLWSPAILGGYPFAANPLSGLWYPPGWLALPLPLPFGFNLVVALHLLWGGVGMYRYLRLEGLGHHAGLCGALAFEAMPKLFAHYGAGHLTLLYAVPWTPWLLWAWQRAHSGETPGGQRTGVGLLPGVVLGLVFLADVRWAVYAGALWWGWAIAHSHLKQRLATLSGLVSQTLFAALFAAPLALPLLEYTRLASRAGLSARDVLAFSLPPERLLGLFYPGVQGYHEWMIYPGAAVLTLALCALLTASQTVRCRVWFWLGAAVLAIVVSLGSWLPFMDHLAQVPGIGLLRVPARALFLTGMAVAVLAATGLEKLLAGLGSGGAWRARWALAGLNGFTLGLALSAGLLAGTVPPGFAWGALAFLAAGAWAWIGIHRPGVPVHRAWLAGLLLIAALDLGGVDLQSFAGRSLESIRAEGEAAAAYLADQPGLFRVYSPSYSIPQHTAVHERLELADGVDPLQLESLAAFMEAASGVPRDGYSVTIPTFASGSPEVANREYRPNPERLGRLNVAYVAADYDLPVEGLVLRERFGETRVYENEFFRPRACVQRESQGAPAVTQETGAFNWTPNRITVTATGPGLLVLSEIAYPGWQVRVDGIRKDIQVVDGLLRGVRLDSGEHTVVFQYRPASLLVGLGLSLAALLFLVSRSVRRRAVREGNREEAGD